MLKIENMGLFTNLCKALITERPVAGLAARSYELVGVKDHDLVLVGLVYENAVNGRCISRYNRKPVAN